MYGKRYGCTVRNCVVTDARYQRAGRTDERDPASYIQAEGDTYAVYVWAKDELDAFAAVTELVENNPDWRTLR